MADPTPAAASAAPLTGWPLALWVASAAAATLTSAAGWLEWHRVFKPLTMGIALAIVAWAVRGTPAAAQGSRARPFHGPLLLAALACSLAGDAFLMFEGFFVAGLASFLLAHLAYIALLRRGVPWLASRRALLGVAAAGGAMGVILWSGGLPAALRVPVAAYVLAIALMAAQALGRAAVLGTPASRSVAVGACCFMLSDALLATHRFVQPLPLSQLAVLATYYTAQILIVRGLLADRMLQIK